MYIEVPFFLWNNIEHKLDHCIEYLRKYLRTYQMHSIVLGAVGGQGD